ncbi:MAG: HAD family hydrolase [Synergistaceae bacterium]|nr:HAD family hydrolase [Synergistaceae bacterium]
MAFNAPFWSPSGASAILFDWDGVIADTRLDFSGIRSKYYGERRAMLLEDACMLAPERRASLMRDLEELEVAGARNAALVPGIDKILEWVEAARIPWAVVSRNCRKSILTAAETIGLQLPHVLLSRDDFSPVKPDPRALREACRQIGVPPSQSLLIGDYIYDMMGARRAGMRGVLVRAVRGGGWDEWLECAYSDMNGLYDELLDPTDMIPWEYQEAAERHGRDFLNRVHRLFLPLPRHPSPTLDTWAARAASIGVGGFVVGDEIFTPNMWKENPSLDIACIGLSLRETINRFTRDRWPFASSRAGESEICPPDDADALPGFLSQFAEP